MSYVCSDSDCVFYRLRIWIVLAGVSLKFCCSAQPAAFPEVGVDAAGDYLRTVTERLQEKHGARTELLFLRARLESQLGQQDEAERFARRALEEDTNRSDIQSFLGDLYIRQARLEDAATSLRKALDLDPKLEGGYRRLGMVLDRLGKHEAAQDTFEAGVRVFPEDATTRLLLGRLLLDHNHVQDAVAHLGKACALAPDSANVFYAFSQAQARAGNRETARETLKTFQELKRKERVVLDAENATRDNDKGMRALASRFHTDVAAWLLHQQRGAQAETHLLQAMRIDPKEPLSYEGLATLYLQTARLMDARGICEDLVRLWPARVTYRVNLGTLLLQLKDYAAATRELKRALELNPRQPEALNNLARFFLGTRQNLPEALEYCYRLVAIQPSAVNYDLLAWALYSNGRRAEAQTASARSVELEPDNPVFRERQKRLRQLP